MTSFSVPRLGNPASFPLTASPVPSLKRPRRTHLHPDSGHHLWSATCVPGLALSEASALPSGYLHTSSPCCSTPSPSPIVPQPRIQGPFSCVSPAYLTDLCRLSTRRSLQVFAPFVPRGILIPFGLADSYSAIEAPAPMAPASSEHLVPVSLTQLWDFPGVGLDWEAPLSGREGVLIHASRELGGSTQQFPLFHHLGKRGN